MVGGILIERADGTGYQDQHKKKCSSMTTGSLPVCKISESRCLIQASISMQGNDGGNGGSSLCTNGLPTIESRIHRILCQDRSRPDSGLREHDPNVQQAANTCFPQGQVTEKRLFLSGNPLSNCPSSRSELYGVH